MQRAAGLLFAAAGRVHFVEGLLKDFAEAQASQRALLDLHPKKWTSNARQQMRVAENEAKSAKNILEDAIEQLSAAIEVFNSKLRELEELEKEE